MEHTVAGQAVELGWRADNVIDLTPLDYLDMVLQKTCAYTTMLPLRVGALIGSWGGADLEAVARFGFALGAAFQIQDDVLDIVSDGNAYGKDLLGDVREGKRTLILIHLLRTCTPGDRAFVADVPRPAGPRAFGALRAHGRGPDARLRQRGVRPELRRRHGACRDRRLRRRVRRLRGLARARVPRRPGAVHGAEDGVTPISVSRWVW